MKKEIVYNIEGPPPKLTPGKAIRKYHVIEKLVSALLIFLAIWLGAMLDSWGFFFVLTPVILLMALFQGWFEGG